MPLSVPSVQERLRSPLIRHLTSETAVSVADSNRGTSSFGGRDDPGTAACYSASSSPRGLSEPDVAEQQADGL